MDTLLEIGKILAVMLPLSAVIAWFLNQVLLNIRGSIEELKASLLMLVDKIDKITTDFAELYGEHKINHRSK
jgi:hypothetical protein